MAAGIVWGVASVFVLVAVGRGFEHTQRAQLESLGDSFVLLRVNRSTKTRGDARANASVLLDGDDMAAVAAGSPSVASLSPKANNWFLQATYGRNITRATAVGVEPQYADIVRVPLEPGGRWIDANDVDQELPVCVLGYGAREDLFGDEPYLGREIRLFFSRDPGDDGALPRGLTVIGAVRQDELAGDEIYTSHPRVVFLPITTWERMSPRDFQFFVMRPKTPDLKDRALGEVRDVLGRRHGFDPTDTNSLVPYFDAIDRKRQIDGVFGGLRVFLSSVGALILLLGAVGVANVVLMSVTARTFEFGLRRALGCKRRWIFAQVFLEAALVCVLSGGLGFLMGVVGVGLLGRAALPEGFAKPQIELAAAWLPGVLLFAVSLAAAAWPAARAARIPVVEALRGTKP
jgi:putative ABC transport system permease protein